MDAEEISLGFIGAERRVPRWFFPSKVGGLPAWQLAPPPTDLFCGVCTPQVPLTLLVQIYAPIEGSPACFHRSVYVFCCLSCGAHFRAISSCLPRDNSEYPNCAVPTFFESKKEFWRLWMQQQNANCLAADADSSRSNSSTSSSSSSSSSSTSDVEGCQSVAAATASKYSSPQQQQHQQLCGTVDKATKAAVINRLQRGERLRHVCCCPVCGLAGGATVKETEHAAAAALLHQQLRRAERRLEVLLQHQQQAAAEAAEYDGEAETSAVTDLDSEALEEEDTEADQRGLLALDALHIQTLRVLHPRCLKRLKFGSVFVSFCEFPLEVETEKDPRASKRTNADLNAALERLGLEGEGKEMTHEEALLRRYQQTIQETPEADLDESEADAFEEIHKKYTSQDQQLEVFLRRCGAPAVRGHVVRYALAGSPLWPFSANQLRAADVPLCACGGVRQFEFQIQPHLISQLAESLGEGDPAGAAALERLSFGLLAVYSCSACCSGASARKGYKEEFVYAQPDPFYG